MCTYNYTPNSYTLELPPNTAWNSMFPIHVHVAGEVQWGFMNKYGHILHVGQHPVHVGIHSDTDWNGLPIQQNYHLLY